MSSLDLKVTTHVDVSRFAAAVEAATAALAALSRALQSKGVRLSAMKTEYRRRRR